MGRDLVPLALWPGGFEYTPLALLVVRLLLLISAVSSCLSGLSLPFGALFLLPLLDALS